MRDTQTSILAIFEINKKSLNTTAASVSGFCAQTEMAVFRITLTGLTGQRTPELGYATHANT